MKRFLEHGIERRMGLLATRIGRQMLLGRNHGSRWPAGRTALALAVTITGAAISGCSSSSPHAQPAPCGVSAKSIGTEALTLTAAAMLFADIHVAAEHASRARCFPLTPGSTVQLFIGDRTEFVANDRPEMEPPNSDVLTTSTRPGPVETGPGSIPTRHLIIRLTAVRPGNVTVHWIDCSGTAC